MTALLARQSPSDLYRRVELDARVDGANSRQLVAICYEKLDAALSASLFADRNGDIAARSWGVTQALSCVTALLLGIDGEAGVAAALRQFYGAARQALLDSALAFSPEKIAGMRQDFADIARATASA
jgi:flagellin-specific chaperone FliS